MTRRHDEIWVRPQLSLGRRVSIPRDRIPEHAVDPQTAYQLVHDELLLDGNARLNLATFVTTWMEPQARVLIQECLDKNLIDKDEYPQTEELERRCVEILSSLWHAPGDPATGTSTTGSSEACMLGGLALLRRWRARNPGRDRPNLVMGANVQVCWHKLCRYWDIEARIVPVGDGTTHLSPERAAQACDESTIGVVAILGSTFDGSYEPVQAIAGALDQLDVDVPIHVDAASGGFIAPFLDAELEWDFRIPRVQSINASGHKYGLVYPGVGWAVWRDPEALPRELLFEVDYLGGKMPDYGLNFSRPGAQVIAQYYTFIRLGHQGYERVQQDCRDVATWLAHHIEELGPFELLSRGDELPVFAFKLRDGIPYSVYDVSEKLRAHGWLVPAYPMPEGMDDVHVLRIVVRNGFTRDMADLLARHLGDIVERLEQPDAEPRPGFHH
ncbi:glutamate decarboxylase [Candidatus Solirubrobacter pratensis]|uniref:glutamate decarboxylase n=1 Tax=Candidatus Solirubrobacter pratensis TaxID=1298857 RepID=UPI00041378F5|nr:glutamate decarboxylase [Candidatus Solirubrobacter pratensis]